MFRIRKTLRYIGRLPTLKVRRSGRKAAATSIPAAFEEVRGVHVTTHADRIVVSDGIYSTYRYRERLADAGAIWNGVIWTLPAGTDVHAVLAPPAKAQTYVAGSFDINDTRGT